MGPAKDFRTIIESFGLTNCRAIKDERGNHSLGLQQDVFIMFDYLFEFITKIIRSISNSFEFIN